MENKNQIFKKGSKTFFYSSLFFPTEQRREVSVLYAFVRKFDDFVDQVPAQKEDFLIQKNKYYLALGGVPSGVIYIDEFVALQKKYNFDQGWVDAFISAMEGDLGSTFCETLEQTEKYMYGSASVVGLMMCKILGISEGAYIYADQLGQAFQYINFIRDIEEDNALKRQYLPKKHYEKYGLPDLSKEVATKHQEKFEKFLREELEYFFKLIAEAKVGFKYIPKRYRIPIEIATNLYLYTAKVIYQNPLIVYSRKIKPSKSRIFLEAIKVIFTI